MEAYAEEKLNVVQMMKFVSERIENYVRKGENAHIKTVWEIMFRLTVALYQLIKF